MGTAREERKRGGRIQYGKTEEKEKVCNKDKRKGGVEQRRLKEKRRYWIRQDRMR